MHTPQAAKPDGAMQHFPAVDLPVNRSRYINFEQRLSPQRQPLLYIFTPILTSLRLYK
jgi:hypothetical protein